jgi:HEPN domain-containing protein
MENVMSRMPFGTVKPLAASNKKDVARDHLERAWSRFSSAIDLFDKGDYASAVQEARKIAEMAALGALIAEGSQNLKGSDILNEKPASMDVMQEILKRTGRLSVALDRFVPGTINPSHYWNVQDARIALDYASALTLSMLRMYAPEVLAACEAKAAIHQNDANEATRQRSAERTRSHEEQEATLLAAFG